MQDLLMKKIRENLYSLVDVTPDLPALLNVFKDKGILSEDEVEEIEKIDISFDKKTTFYWTIIKKEDEAFDLLLETFKSTGNEEGVKILSKEAPVETVEADVTVESTNQEGVDFAEDMEKEFDRIQTQESESEPELQGHGSEDEGKPEIQVTQEFLKSESEAVVAEEKEAQEDLPAKAQEVQEVQEVDDDEADLVESLVRVEVTPPDSPAPEADHDELPKNEEVVETFEIKQVEKVPEPVEEPKAKQVSFETPKEFIISKDNVDASKSSDEEMKSGKSIVAQNRELFEKSAPKGVRVTYNFKKDDASASAASQETPENKVANLKNFFQNLGSKGSKDDSSTPVERRGGNKLGGVHPNRRTVAS